MTAARFGPRFGLILWGTWALCACGPGPSPQYDLEPAILDNDVRKVQLLLDGPDVDVNWRPNGTATPLGIAAAHGRLEIAKLLLQRGADPNLESDLVGTPLSSAAYHGDLEMCKLLIEAGTDVNKGGGRYEWTPLQQASYKGHADVVQLLLKSGAKQ